MVVRLTPPLPALALALLPLTACGDTPTEPPVPYISMRLCVGDWVVAVQNEGRAWTGVPSRNGVVEFLATERLGIAAARVVPRSPFLHVLYLTAPQVRDYFACGPGGAIPPSSFTGVVVGLGGDEYTEVTYGGGSSATVSWLDSTFEAYVLPGENDLVATHQPAFTIAQHVDRAIIRRAQAYPPDTGITLDFQAGEAFALAGHTLHWTSPYAFLQVNFRTASGNNNLLQYSYAGAPGSGEAVHDETLYSIPASRLAPGDLHELYLGSDQRSVDLYYHEPQDRTLELGPPANQPMFTTLGSSPRYRFRVAVPSLPAYGGGISVTYGQQMQPGMTSRSIVSLEASNEFFNGAPGVWNLEVPDLSGIPELAGWTGLPPGDYEWAVFTTSVWGMRPALATDGLLVRSATVSGTRRQ